MEVVDDGERQYPVRRYQNRNLKDLDFPDIEEAASDTHQTGGRVPSLLPYFTQSSKYCTTAVLEESVINNESLKQTAFLKSFDPRFVDELFKVEGCTRAVVYLPDMEISHQGDKADSLVVIVHGQVEVFVDGILQRRLGDGDYFGEREFLGVRTDRVATAVAITFCDARFMYRNCLTRTLERCPAMRDDYPYMLSIWSRKSERDALRFMKVFSKKCMECMDTPDPSKEQIGESTEHSPRLTARFGSSLQTSGASSLRSSQQLRASVGADAVISPRGITAGAGDTLGASGSPALRKIGQAPVKAGRAIAC